MTTKLGRELAVGDTIEVWWRPNRDTITKLEPYTGAYRELPEWRGVRIASFALLRTGMTIFPEEVYELPA